VIGREAIGSLEFEKVLGQVLRYVVTEGGRTSIQDLPIQTDIALIRSEQSLVSEAKALIESEGDIPLESMIDVSSIVRRAGVGGTTLTPKELLAITTVLRSARNVRSFVSKNRTESVVLWQLAETLYTDKILEFNIERAIEPSGDIRSDASKELRRIRRTIVEAYEALRKRLHRILREVSDHGLVQEDIITTREGRMVIPLKSEHQGRLPGFIHSASSSGATVFIEPTETLELNNEITDLQFREKREIEKILAELTGQVREVHQDILRAAEVLARIDSIQARARYSVASISVEPLLTEDGPVSIRAGRHPLLLLSHGFDGTVPVDLELGSRFNTLVISGPNAGGKSVAMKCAGLFAVMAQAGMHVPAGPDTQLRVFDRIFVDIGDMQSIENDLSTFSSHLAILKTILEHAGDRTLVLLDEIGTGTDPTEGGAIGAAVLEELTERGTLTIATTHHGSLKVFAHDTEGVENGAMEFDQKTLRPTYRFKTGVPGSSYALEMAERLSIEPGILKRARELQGDSKSGIETLLAELEASRQKQRHDIAELKKKQDDLAAMVREYETKKAGLSSEVRKTRLKAEQDAKELVEKANALIERTVREIRESQADRTVTRGLRKEVEELRQDLGTEQEDPGTGHHVEAIRPGTTVVLRRGSEPGTVDTIDDARRTAYVLFGTVRMKVPLRELVSAPNVPGEAVKRHAPPPAFSSGDVPKEADVRGLNGDEAVDAVDRLLDSAILAGLHRVDVIHGKGTGVLRKRISEFLTGDKRVKSFRLGEWNEGGGGATIVELSDE